MSGMLKAIGRGLFAAGLLLLFLYFVGLHLTGLDALQDALYPFAVKTYLPLLLLAPGAFPPLARRPPRRLASLLPFQRFFSAQQQLIGGCRQAQAMNAVDSSNAVWTRARHLGTLRCCPILAGVGHAILWTHAIHGSNTAGGPRATLSSARPQRVRSLHL